MREGGGGGGTLKDREDENWKDGVRVRRRSTQSSIPADGTLIALDYQQTFISASSIPHRGDTRWSWLGTQIPGVGERGSQH